MYTIQLHNLILYGSHGIYENEKKLLSPFEIHLDILLNPSVAVNQLNDSIDYATVYVQLKKRMEKPTGLLEVLCDDIINEIAAMSSNVEQVRIQICKMNPDISGFSGKVCVSLEKSMKIN